MPVKEKLFDLDSFYEVAGRNCNTIISQRAGKSVPKIEQLLVRDGVITMSYVEICQMVSACAFYTTRLSNLDFFSQRSV